MITGGLPDDVRLIPTLTLDGARRATEAAIAFAEELGVHVVIVVCDITGDPLTVTRMDGAFRFSIEVAEKKAWTSVTSGAPTSALAALFLEDPELLHGLAPAVDRLLPVSGGAPVIVDGQVAGAIGVSGATADQDQRIAEAAAAAITG